MLEICADDIKRLNDADLRELVALLCEIEVESQGGSSRSVTWGGHQNAPDGGSDVRFEALSLENSQSFLFNNNMVFQVKKYKMPPGKIKSEMVERDGRLKNVIIELDNKSGAYIIVSGEDSTSDRYLKDRIKKMEEVVMGYGCSHIQVKFYDSNILATWVRKFPSLITWVREKGGNPLYGWKTYGNWSKIRKSQKFIYDDTKCFLRRTNCKQVRMSVIEGIQEVRDRLKCQGGHIRFTGLSGVGKTRFLEAIFDDSIGARPVFSKNVVYTDMQTAPIPSAERMLEDLAVWNVKSILIVDNCSLALHEKLINVSDRMNNVINLVTVEYDIADDIPEATSSYSLDSVSDNVIKKIICSNYSKMDVLIVEKIAKISGGNIRLAFLLASTVDEGIANTITDKEFFNRMFWQNKAIDENLLNAAKVCSLVFSFNASIDEQEEMTVLCNIAGQDIKEFDRNISELARRNLIQERGKWRAVLPHALANRLAKEALEDYRLMLHLLFKGRLGLSFSKRLGYFSNSKISKDIVKRWIASEGFNINSSDIYIFENIAALVPQVALEVIDGMKHKKYLDARYAHILQEIAFDDEYFEACVDLLSQMNEIRDINQIISTMFSPYYEFTQANLAQRFDIIKNLLSSHNEHKVKIGLECVKQALDNESRNLTPNFIMNKGITEKGYSPKDIKEISTWQSKIIEYCVDLYNEQGIFSLDISRTLISNWKMEVYFKEYGQIETAIYKLKKNIFWREGYAELIDIINHHKGRKESETINIIKLEQFANDIKPNNLKDEILYWTCTRFYLLRKKELGDEEYCKKLYEFGKLMGRQIDIFEQVFYSINEQSGYYNSMIGKGLVHSGYCVEVWEKMKELLKIKINLNISNVVIISFFVFIEEKDKEKYYLLLDELFHDDILKVLFPLITSRVSINKLNCERLITSIRNQEYSYESLSKMEYPHSSIFKIDEDSFFKLLYEINNIERGKFIAWELLSDKIRYYSKDDISFKSKVLDYLEKYDIIYERNMMDNVKVIIEFCCKEDKLLDKIELVYIKIRDGLNQNIRLAVHEKSIAYYLCKCQWRLFLDVFLGDGIELTYEIEREIYGRHRIGQKVLELVDEENLNIWAEQNPKVRYSKIIRCYGLIYNEKGVYEWKDISKKMIAFFAEDKEMTKDILYAVEPHSATGSFAKVYQDRLHLFDYFEIYKHTTCYITVQEMKQYFLRQIRFHEDREFDRDEEINTFEIY